MKLKHLVYLCCFTSPTFAAGSFFDTSSSGPVVQLTSKINRYYSSISLNLSTPGYELSSSDINQQQNRTSLFSLNALETKAISIIGPNGLVNFELCMNGPGHLSCQRYNTTVNNLNFAVGIAEPLIASDKPQIFRSIDGGASWEEPTLFDNPDSELKTIACTSSGQNCVAGGYNNTTGTGLIYTTSNRGESWSDAIQPSSGSLSNIRIWGMSHSSTGSRVIAVGQGTGATGFVEAIAYLSTDGGSTWSEPVTVDNATTSPILNAISCNTSGQHCVSSGYLAGGTPGLTAVTDDFGVTWTNTSPAALTNQTVLYGVSCSSDGIQCLSMGYTTDAATGNQVGISYTSGDGGTSWDTPIYLITPEVYTDTNIQSVSCDRSGRLCNAVGVISGAVIQNPVVYKTTDGGVTWTNPVLPAASNVNQFNSVFCTSSGGICTAVGHDVGNAISYTSTDGGSTWSGPVKMPNSSGTTANAFGSSGAGG